MKAPIHLSHKPIIAVNDYDLIDGKYANLTDAKALSLGRAQYNKSEISAKVFRKINKKWSRQSEELPVHRVLDLAILIVATMVSKKKQLHVTSNLNEEIATGESVDELLKYYAKNKQYLDPRLKELKKQLDALI